MTAESQLYGAEQALGRAESALSDALTKAGSVRSTAPASGPGGLAGGSTSGGPAVGGGRAAGTVTAAQIAADQAAVDAANAQVSAVQQKLAATQLVSPIAGTVALLRLTVGQQVTAGAVNASGAAAQLVVVGPGAFQAVTAVSATDVAAVKLGQPATVLPDGSTTPLTGSVVSIGLLGSAATGYPVAIGLTSGSQQLFAGSAATVSITVKEVTAGVTVPTSAVHSRGAASFVDVLRGGVPTPVRVTIGAVGPTLTEVTAGLGPGDQVELADPSLPLPTNSLPNIRRFIGGAPERARPPG